MNRVGDALKRKLGPLPAWAWLAIAGGAIVIYRRWSGGAGAPQSVPDSPGISDGTVPAQGTVLQPGEAYVPPGSGPYVNTPDPSTPTDGGGGTGGGGAGGTAGSGTSKRTAKPKAAHKHIPKLGPLKPKARAQATTRKITHAATKAARGSLAHTVRSVTSRKPKPAATAAEKPGRSRAPMPRSAAPRDRPAAPRVVHHTEQRVGQHPARAQQPPAAHPSHVPVVATHTSTAPKKKVKR